MTEDKLMKQLVDIGVPRHLNNAETEHVICLLRLIEQLPKISAVHNNISGPELTRKLTTIHENHLELAKSASLVLSKARTVESNANE